MKFIFVVVSAFFISTNGLQIPEELIRHSSVAIAKGISTVFLNRFKYGLYEKADTETKNPRMSLLPDLDDPATLRDLEMPLELNLGELFKSTGHLSMCSPKVTGLSQATDNLTLGTVGGLFVDWILEVPTTLALTAPYQISQILNSPTFFPDAGGDINFTGEGQFLASLDNLFFELKLNASGIMDKLVLNELWFDIGFKNLTAQAENTAVDGKPIDMDGLAGTIQTLFDVIWTEENKIFINEMVTCSVAHAIHDCNVLELINMIYWCLDPTPATECFGSEEADFKFGDLKPSAIGFCDPTATGTPIVTGSDDTTPIVTGSNSEQTTPSVTASDDSNSDQTTPSVTASDGSNSDQTTPSVTASDGSTVETTTDNTGGVTIVRGTFLAIVVAICVSFYHRV